MILVGVESRYDFPRRIEGFMTFDDSCCFIPSDSTCGHLHVRDMLFFADTDFNPNRPTKALC